MKVRSNILFVFIASFAIILFIIIFVDQFKFSKITTDELSYVTEELVDTRSVKNYYVIECKSGNEYKISYIVFCINIHHIPTYMLYSAFYFYEKQELPDTVFPAFLLLSLTFLFFLFLRVHRYT